MKITKLASGKQEIRINKKEWQNIGKKAGWMDYHDCPKCGQPNSAYDDQFCGKCEGQYQADKQTGVEAEIEQLRQEINNCKCSAFDEYCQTCNSKYSQILSLQGKENEAIAWMNR